MLHTSGLHVNFSLWDKEGNNIFERGKTMLPVNRRLAINDALYSYVSADTLLIAPSPQGYTRHKVYPDIITDVGMHNDSGFLGFTQRLPGAFTTADRVQGLDVHPARAEFMSPASDARHDLCVLMTLTAIYQGLAHKEREAPSYGGPAASLSEAVTRFTDSSALMQDLSAIAKGDKQMQAHVKGLHQAVLEAFKACKLTQPSLEELNPSLALQFSR